MEANALANEDFCTFDLSKRIRVVPEDLGFKVLSAAMELDAEIRLTEAAKEATARSSAEPSKRGANLGRVPIRRAKFSPLRGDCCSCSRV